MASDRLSSTETRRYARHLVLKGMGKAESAQKFVLGLNPEVTVRLHSQLTPDNAATILPDYDVVLDGTDNLVTRRAVAEATAMLGRPPLVSGAVSMFDGQVTVFAPGGPGFDALYPDSASDDDLPSCEAAGILGPLTGVIGTLMAMEAIKLITGIGEPLIGRVLTYDSQGARFAEFSY
ncbi:MAG: HesA/MoeB/ThiF family protein [Candidatus Devosia euplotis]|nr:HesA/MoeB/ThiF family protein [Candidatus Devosia euplotis]